MYQLLVTRPSILPMRLLLALTALLLVTYPCPGREPPDSNRNLIANGRFAAGTVGELPSGWSLVAPNPVLAPKFKLAADAAGRQQLLAQGNGRDECFGYIWHPVELSGGKTYRFSVRFRFEALADVNRHLLHGLFVPNGWYKRGGAVALSECGLLRSAVHARAADNGLAIAASSLNCPAGIWDSGGHQAGEKEPDSSRYAPTNIVDSQRDEEHRMLVATLDLSRSPSPHWWGGPMLSAPAARRVRQTWRVPLEEEIAREARRWHEPEQPIAENLTAD